MNELILEGKSLHFSDTGNGPAILFGHSFLWDHRMFKPQIEALSQTHRCIVPDLWAHGSSDNPPDASKDLTSLAKDHLALMDHLGIRNFSLVGLSIGGMWGLRLALLAGQRLQRLVLCSTDGGSEPEITKSRYLQLLTVLQARQSVPPPVIQEIAPGFFSPDSSPDLISEFSRELAAILSGRIPGVIRMGRAFIERDNILNQLSEIRCPTLILCGEHDHFRPIPEAQRLQAALADAQLEVLPSAGHILTLEQPTLANRLLTEFLTKRR